MLFRNLIEETSNNNTLNDICRNMCIGICGICFIFACFSILFIISSYKSNTVYISDTFNCTPNSSIACNNGICNENGTDCVCDDNYITYNSINNTKCNYKKYIDYV